MRQIITLGAAVLCYMCHTALAQDPKLAPDDLAYFLKTSQEGHLIAQVEMQMGPKAFLRYRYDRFPGFERIALDDGTAFVRAGGDWVSSSGWELPSSVPYPEDAKEKDKLDDYAALVNLAFQKPEHHDKNQGDTVWKLTDHAEKDGYETFTYEMSREKPHKDGVYPQFTFLKRTGDQDGYLALQWFAAQIRAGESLVPIQVKYDFVPDKTPGMQPEEMLFYAKKALDGKPLKVDAYAGGDANCRIAGIVAGKDFDLTVMTPEKSFRQIAVGDTSWLSADGGKTWKKQATTDRRYYFLAHTAVKYDAQEMIPPFEKMGDDLQQDGVTVRRVRLLAPEATRYDGDRSDYRLAMKDGWPESILHFDGPLVFVQQMVIVNADYSVAPSGVKPPPGNPEAVPETGAEMLLMYALRKMNAGGLWKVDATAEAGKTSRISGLVSGRDFDLTQQPQDAGGTPLREIAIGQKAWATFDGGKTWRKEQPDDRLPYNLVYAAVVAGRMERPFETVGKEEVDGETLLHIRIKEKGEDSGKDRMHYWLSLDKDGNPAGVRRYTGPMYMDGNIVYCDVGFTPAPGGVEIKPPKGGK